MSPDECNKRVSKAKQNTAFDKCHANLIIWQIPLVSGFMGSNFLRDWNWNNNLSQLGLGEIVGQLRTQKEPMKRSGYKKMPIRRLSLQQPLEGQIDKSLLSSYAWIVCNILKILQNLRPLENILILNTKNIRIWLKEVSYCSKALYACKVVLDVKWRKITIWNVL